MLLRPLTFKLRNEVIDNLVGDGILLELLSDDSRSKFNRKLTDLGTKDALGDLTLCLE